MMRKALGFDADDDDLNRMFSDLNMSTEDVTLISHTHGRNRRSERGIDKLDLKKAIKYGKKERANPGRKGDQRWRYTYQGVVYITDATSKHEITSWKTTDAEEAQKAVIGSDIDCDAHFVLVVDHSGSMRKTDVPGYDTRLQAVYDCIARDLVKPQLELTKVGTGINVVVSLIELSGDGTIVFTRQPVDDTLLSTFEQRKREGHARSHGHYIPALKKVNEILQADYLKNNRLFVLILSDGAPSDHIKMACEHGIKVWEQDESLGLRFDGRPRLKTRSWEPDFGYVDCPHPTECRKLIKKEVETQCCAIISDMGDLFGRDRLTVATIAFGPPKEEFRVLEQIAKVLPQGIYQKLGLSAARLRTAFSSINTTMTTLRTDAASAKKVERSVQKTNMFDWFTPGAIDRGTRRYHKKANGWANYIPRSLCCKERWSDTVNDWVRPDFKETNELVVCKKYFAKGAERLVFQCVELNKDMRLVGGTELVAKEGKFVKDCSADDYHTNFCKVQGISAQFAKEFNRRLGPHAPACVHMEYLPCWVYTVINIVGEEKWIAAEPRLEGKFTKWNNNNGIKKTSGFYKYTPSAMLDTMSKMSKDSLEHHVHEVPQAFSHFTYEASAGKCLVCDIQGIWNWQDGFTLTDPVVHHVGSKKHRYGKTDQGIDGIKKFFESHVCGTVCERLGLVTPTF